MVLQIHIHYIVVSSMYIAWTFIACKLNNFLHELQVTHYVTMHGHYKNFADLFLLYKLYMHQ